MGEVKIAVSWAELLDKITILRIKEERMSDPAKLANVRRELAMLQAVVAESGGIPEVAEPQVVALKQANEAIWDLEEEIRAYDRREEFGPSFVACARRIYRSNDHRAAIKRTINELFNSAIVEEKSYE